MSTTQNAFESIETLTDRMKTWLSRSSSVPQEYLDRYERQQADHPGSETRRRLARINPKIYAELLSTRFTMLKSHRAHVHREDMYPFNAAEARDILCVLNSIPLATQYFSSAVKVRVNAAMRHVKSYHINRVRVDKWQRGNVFKRAMWRHKLKKGKRLPAEAALWEGGYVSRTAVKESYKMPRLAKRFLREAWEMKMLCGECAFWMKMMGVVEARSDKVFYDIETKEWGTIDEPLIAASELEMMESDEYDERESEQDEDEADTGEEQEEEVETAGKLDYEVKKEDVEGGKVELSEDHELQLITKQESEPKSVPEVVETEDTDEEKERDIEVEENEVEEEEEAISPEDRSLQPVTSQHSQLETVPEANEQDLEAMMNVEASQLTDPSGAIITSTQPDSPPATETGSQKVVDSEDSESDLPYTPDLEPIEERREEEDAEEQSYLKAKANAKAAAKQPATNNPSAPQTTQPPPTTQDTAQPADPEDPAPSYHEAYFHPKVTDRELAIFHTERLKSTVNREQLWNPPPRYLDAASQRYCMDEDSKWRVRTPRLTQRQALERRKGEERRRKREAEEKYERETPFWRQWGNGLKRLTGEAVEEVIRREEGWVDEKSEAYAHILQMTMMFGRGEPPAREETESAPAATQLSPANDENKEAQSSVGVPQSGIHVKRQVSIHRCRLTRPFRQRTKTTIETTNMQPNAKPTTIFTRAKQSLVVRRRAAGAQQIPPTPKKFTPSPENLEQFRKAVKKLLKQRRKVMAAHLRVARFMDGWDKSVNSGQAWMGSER